MLVTKSPILIAEKSIFPAASAVAVPTETFANSTTTSAFVAKCLSFPATSTPDAVKSVPVAIVDKWVGSSCWSAVKWSSSKFE